MIRGREAFSCFALMQAGMPALQSTSVHHSSLTIHHYPSFSFTNVKIAVAILTTINVAMARQTASDSVNFQMASMQRTVHATSDIVMTTKAIQRTIAGLTTPRDSVFSF